MLPTPKKEKQNVLRWACQTKRVAVGLYTLAASLALLSHTNNVMPPFYFLVLLLTVSINTRKIPRAIYSQDTEGVSSFHNVLCCMTHS